MRPMHIDYVETIKDKLVFTGLIFFECGLKMVVSVWVIEVHSIEENKEITAWV